MDPVLLFNLSRRTWEKWRKARERIARPLAAAAGAVVSGSHPVLGAITGEMLRSLHTIGSAPTSEIAPTRVGSAISDRSPFYQSDLRALYSYYYSYADSEQFAREILYAEVKGIISGSYTPVDDISLDEKNLTVILDAREY